MLSPELESAVRTILNGPADGWDAALAELCEANPRSSEAIRTRFTEMSDAVDRAALPTELPLTGGNQFAPQPATATESSLLPVGSFLADRYRIVQLIGRGGMGEVYRADDSSLGTPVAIKVLPQSLQQSRRRLELFRAEVRLARRVSHPNVCRVHDIGESGGRTFLSMELVEGEDLATLLHRVGRLPFEQAMAIARQLCAALAALHEQGLVHRDLKPANVLIDGDGRAKLADFGVATTANQTSESGAVGTPLYMAPEQLRGQTETSHSDIYSLGLLLYELFSGERARKDKDFDAWLFDGDAELRPLSKLLDCPAELDAAIAQCMRADPIDRPSSAFAVLALLPGGDPLRAVVEAQQIPSPDLVAAAGKGKRLSKLAAIALLVVGLCCLPIEALIKELHSMHRAVQLDKSPTELVEGARTVLRWLGYERQPRDHFAVSGLKSLTAQQAARQAMPQGQYGTAGFDALVREQLGNRFPTTFRTVYVESPSFLRDAEKINPFVRKPPAAGGIAICMTQAGDLFWLRASAPIRLSSMPTAPEISDAELLQRAGLEPASFEAVEPDYVPAGVACDQRTAWLGVYPGLPDFPVRVDIARLNGRVVAFGIVRHFDRRDVPKASAASAPVLSDANALSFAQSAYGTVFLTAVIAALAVAYRQWREGRGDVRGARRLAGAVFALMMIRWLLTTHHAPSVWEELGPFEQGLANAAQFALVAFVLYLAGEPFIRRHAPHLLTSWTRLLAGRSRDAAVGRDVLIGVAFATAYKVSELVFKTDWSDPLRSGSGVLCSVPGARMASAVHAVGITATDIADGIVEASLTLFAAVVIIRMCRRRTLGVIVATAVMILASRMLFGFGVGISAHLAAASFGVLAMVAALRFGLLVLAVSFATAMILNSSTTTFDPNDWYFPSFATDIAVLAVALGIGFRWAVAREQESPSLAVNGAA